MSLELAIKGVKESAQPDLLEYGQKVGGKALEVLRATRDTLWRALQDCSPDRKQFLWRMGIITIKDRWRNK